MKQHRNHQQSNQFFDSFNQQLLATSTLRELTQEEENPFKGNKPNITYRCHYNPNSPINSWSAQYSSLLPKENNKRKFVIPKMQQINHEHKLKRKVYEHTSTTLLQFGQSIEIFTQKSKTNQKGKQKHKNRITPLNTFSERNKMLLKTLKNQRAHLSNPFMINCSFEDTTKITELTKPKNKESSAIKKLKCELIQKTQLKNEQRKVNLLNFNTSKVRFSLQPKIQHIRHSRYVTVEGQNEVKQKKQNCRKRMIRTLYHSSIRQSKREITYNKIYSVDSNKPERGLVSSQQFKILINLLKKEKGSQQE